MYSERAARTKAYPHERRAAAIEDAGRGAEHVPPELNTDPQLVASGRDAESVVLRRGQHRVELTIPYDGPEVHRRDFMQSVPYDGEFKRLWVYKQDVRPIEGKTGPDGEPVAKVTLVFRVLDNPLPLVPIAWAVAGIGSAAGGWFFIDKVEEFTETTTGKVLSVAASIATLLGLWLVLSS